MLHFFQTILHVEVWAAIISVITAILGRGLIFVGAGRGNRAVNVFEIVSGVVKLLIYFEIAHALPIEALWANILFAVFLFSDGVWNVVMFGLMVIMKVRGTVQRTRGGV